MSERTLRHQARMRIVFREEEPVKYISHLDLLRAWERILRRAGLPLAYSLGYNPHPRITIATPLPVGCTGEREMVDVLLYEARSPQALLDALAPALPEGIAVVEAHPVPLQDPPLPTLISHLVYHIALESITVEEVSDRARALMARDTLEVTFRRKTFDLRALVGALAAREGQARSGPVLEATLLRAPSGRIGRPDVLLDALALSAHARQVHRKRIVFRETGI
jgi:radical SAM-linked protein